MSELDILKNNQNKVQAQGNKTFIGNKENKMDDILEKIEAKNEEKKDYTEETNLNQQNVDIETKFTAGSVKITRELATKAKLAVEERIEATRSYTKERVDRIDQNWQLYYSEPSIGQDSTTLSKVFIPETFNACEDWSDDLYLIFEDLIGQLELEDIGDSVEDYLMQTLETSTKEDKTVFGTLRSLAQKVFGVGNIKKEKNVYFFSKKDAIKSMLKYALHKSGYENESENFYLNGIITGMFALVDSWGTRSGHQLLKGGKKDSEFRLELDQEQFYQFTPVDPRLLIFPKKPVDGVGIPWFIQKIPTTYHALLELVLDEKNKPIDGAPYDIQMLKEVGAYIKEQGASDLKEKEPESFLDEVDETDNVDEDLNNLWDIDGQITLYVAHYIPLVFESNGKKRAYKSMMTFVNINSADDDRENLVPLGIQETPYVAGLPLLTTNFINKDGDVAGMGLPQLIFELQKLLNNFSAHSQDIINLGLGGVMIIDPDVVTSSEKLQNITPRMILKLKNMKGRRVSDVISWLHPPLDTVKSTQNMFNLYQAYLSRTTRRGPTGEKITPNPSATEVSSIIEERGKSVNKTALRINNLYVNMLERIYIYNMLNRKDKFRLKIKGMKIKDRKKMQTEIDQRLEDAIEDHEILDKIIDLSPEEIFIDGLNFNITALEAFNKRSTERQQAMQAVNLVYGNGVVKDQQGQPNVMQDETGARYIISEYKLVKRLLTIFDMDDILEKIEATQQTIPEVPPMPGQQAGVQGSTSVPPLTASPAAGDIAKQGITLSPGVNV
jgi:hypothetical protein